MPPSDLNHGGSHREGAASKNSEPYLPLLQEVPGLWDLGLFIPRVLGCLFSPGRGLRMLWMQEQLGGVEHLVMHLGGPGKCVTKGENPAWNC